MARFTTLYSGSSGNSAMVEENGSFLLIDMGRSCRMTINALKSLGLAPENLCGVLVTHEHSDHISGLCVFLKKYAVPVYASAATLEYLLAHGLVPENTQLMDIDGITQNIGGFEVQSFETSHDSLACRGYRITTPQGKVVSIATDLGFVSDEVLANLLLSDVVGLESNYDPVMLMSGTYPYYLKMRIASANGHLSNEECAATIVTLAQNGCRHFALCHISKENNTPELALEHVRAAMDEAGFSEDAQYTLQAAMRSDVSPVIEF